MTRSRKCLFQGGEELIELGASGGALPGTEDGHWFFARPDLAARVGIAVVQGDLCVPETGVHPREEVVAITHPLIIEHS